MFFSGVGDGTTQTPRGYLLAVIVCVVIGLQTLFWSSYKVKEVVKPPKHQVKIPMKKQLPPSSRTNTPSSSPSASS